VIVGLGPADTPTFVGYSAHCTGVWRPWSRAPVVSRTDDVDLQHDDGPEERGRHVALALPDDDDGPRGMAGNVALGTAAIPAAHPLVVVAGGSHANYPTTGRRKPDWASCESGLDELRLGLGNLSFAANAFETTGEFGPMQLPAVAPVAEARRVLGTPWYWGRTETYRLSNTTLRPPATTAPRRRRSRATPGRRPRR
jgi:hypothetical protein